MNRYSLKQSQSLLGGIDFKTLQRWLDKLGIVPEQSRADERFKYLTREQLERLATSHERELPPIDQPVTPEASIPHTAYKLLLDRLSSLEEWREAELAARTESFQEQFRALQTAVGELNKRTEGITLLLEERRRQKITEDSQLANVLADLKIQINVVQSQANSLSEWFGKLQFFEQGNQRDIAQLNQAVQALQTELTKQASKSSKPASRRGNQRNPH